MDLTKSKSLDTFNMFTNTSEITSTSVTIFNEPLPYNETFCVDLTPREWEIHYQFRWWLEGVGMVLVGTFGVIFNIIAIFVLMSQEMIGIRFNNLVVCLAIVDNIFLLTSIFYHIGHAFGFAIQQSYFHQRLFASFVYPWRGISMCCSTYITVALALDRYRAVSNPSKYKASVRSHTHPIIMVLRCTLPIICLSILFSIPKFFDLSVKEYPEGINSTNETSSQSYFIVGTDLRENKKYVLWYVNVANFIVTCFVPLASLSYLNGQLILKRNTFIQRQIERRRSSFHGSEYRRYSIASLKIHRQQTIILHTIVIVFLLCHALRIVLNINEWVTMEDKIKSRELEARLRQLNESMYYCSHYRFWSTVATPLSHLLLQINSGANFFIYSVLNETFSRVLRQKINRVLQCFKTSTQRSEVNNEPTVIYRKSTKSVSTQQNRVVVTNCEIMLQNDNLSI